MTPIDIKTLIQEQLPVIMAEDALIRDFILRTVSEYYSPKREIDKKFDRILAELQRDREQEAQIRKENNRKWEENNRQWEENNRKWEENNRKWEENNRQWEENTQRLDENTQRLDRIIDEQNQKWEENNRQWKQSNERLDRIMEEQNQKWAENNLKWDQQYQQNREILEEIRLVNRKHDSTIGALGSRWGLYSEASFRNGLKAILEDSFGVQVLNINDFDHDGEIFGRPDQVEIDIIIQNGLIIACEIKSSISKSEMYIFNRKVEFYEKSHQRTINRKLVISPMVDNRALPVAENLGIEVYSYAEDIPNL